VSEKQLSYTQTTAPHTLITIVVDEEPSEDLFKAEALIIAAAMISRLEGDEGKAYSVIPVRNHHEARHNVPKADISNLSR
jgi:hypothetical protein